MVLVHLLVLVRLLNHVCLLKLVRRLDLVRLTGYKRVLCAPRLAEKDVRQRGSQHQ